jgi:hypothetical protein
LFKTDYIFPEWVNFILLHNRARPMVALNETLSWVSESLSV